MGHIILHGQDKQPVVAFQVVILVVKVVVTVTDYRSKQCSIIDLFHNKFSHSREPPEYLKLAHES